MHRSAPSCGVADVKGDSATIWSSTQGAHALKGALSQLVGLPSENVHVIWTEGSGCYGHNGSDDAAADAALLSQAVGKPVRVQWSRADEHGWEPKGVAMAMDVSGGVDADGRIVGWDYAVWTPTHSSRPNAQAGGGARELHRRPTRRRHANAARIARRRTQRATYVCDPEYARRRAPAPVVADARVVASADSARHRTVSPTNRSWTSWRSPPAPTRSSSVCDISPIRGRSRFCKPSRGLGDGGRGTGGAGTAV